VFVVRIRLEAVVLILGLSFVTADVAFAQAPPEPPRPLTAAVSAGLALTSGNTDTSTIDVGYQLGYDPGTRNRVKSDGLFMRGKTAGELSTDNLTLNGRDEYQLYERAFVFGQMQYLKDRFKEIDYLVSPTAGLGYRFLDTPRTKLSGDAGLGVLWEKNPGFDVETSGAFSYSEKLTHQLSATTTLTQSLSGLHKTDDFSDALYQFGASVGATVTTHTQLKVELLDTYKNKPPTAGIVKNDVAVLLALVYKY
jgi:putative salt-induced outer membrane protein